MRSFKTSHASRPILSPAKAGKTEKILRWFMFFCLTDRAPTSSCYRQKTRSSRRAPENKKQSNKQPGLCTRRATAVARPSEYGHAGNRCLFTTHTKNGRQSNPLRMASRRLDTPAASFALFPGRHRPFPPERRFVPRAARPI